MEGSDITVWSEANKVWEVITVLDVSGKTPLRRTSPPPSARDLITAGWGSRVARLGHTRPGCGAV
ncbi:MAG: hypothetical protein R2755_31485 [Acidimicrobiales bacterium]